MARAIPYRSGFRRMSTHGKRNGHRVSIKARSRVARHRFASGCSTEHKPASLLARSGNIYSRGGAEKRSHASALAGIKPNDCCCACACSDACAAPAASAARVAVARELISSALRRHDDVRPGAPPGGDQFYRRTDFCFCPMEGGARMRSCLCGAIRQAHPPTGLTIFLLRRAFLLSIP